MFLAVELLLIVRQIFYDRKDYLRTLDATEHFDLLFGSVKSTSFFIKSVFKKLRLEKTDDLSQLKRE